MSCQYFLLPPNLMQYMPFEPVMALAGGRGHHACACTCHGQINMHIRPPNNNCNCSPSDWEGATCSIALHDASQFLMTSMKANEVEVSVL